MLCDGHEPNGLAQRGYGGEPSVHFDRIERVLVGVGVHGRVGRHAGVVIQMWRRVMRQTVRMMIVVVIVIKRVRMSMTSGRCRQIVMTMMMVNTVSERRK